MTRRARLPLNQSARVSANERLYREHAHDPRPNALYDADGKRRRLSDTDPAQAGLRKAWMDYYVAAGGRLEREGEFSEGSTPGQTIAPCAHCWIRFRVVADRDGKPIPGVRLDVIRPSGRLTHHVTDAHGLVTLRPAEPGPHELRGDLEGVRFPQALHAASSEQEPGGGGNQPPTAASDATAGEDRNESEEKATVGRYLALVKRHKVRSGETLESLAQEAGIPWQTLAEFNFGTREPARVNRHLHQDVGCTRRTAGGNYRFHDDDNPGIVLVPKPLRMPGLAVKQTHRVRVAAVSRPVWIDVQTVDEMGCRVAEVALTLTTREGRVSAVKTDKRGYWAGVKEVDGPLAVSADGKPLCWYREDYRQRDLAPGDRDADSEACKQARIAPLLAHDTVTSVMVPRVEAKTLARRDALLRRYSRLPVHLEAARKATVKADGRREGEAAGDLDADTRGRKGEHADKNERHFGVAVDNLFLAMTWGEVHGPIMHGSAAQPGLLDLLPDWLAAHYPSAIARGWYILVFWGHDLFAFEAGGRLLGRFTLRPRASLDGAFGGYAAHEFSAGEWKGWSLFRDLRSRTVPIRFDTGDEAKDKEEEEAKTKAWIVPVRELLPKGQREAWVRLLGQQGDKVALMYYLPRPTKFFFAAALHGGTGLLESYPADAGLAKGVHARNTRVVSTVAAAYEAWVRGYIKAVEDKEKVKSVADLRALGPPRAPFYFPRPAGVEPGDERWLKLYRIQNKGVSLQLQLIKAVYERLCALQGVYPEGSVWMRVHYEAEAQRRVGPGKVGLTGSMKVEGNFDLGSMGFKTSEKRTWKTGVNLKDVPMLPKKLGLRGLPNNLEGGVYVEKDLETGLEKVVVEVSASRKVGPVTQGVGGLEVHSDGERVVKGPRGTYSKWNPATGEGGFGACIELGTGGTPGSGVKAEAKTKYCLGLHFRLLSEDTMLALLCHGMRSFWERRPLQELVVTNWRTLRMDERTKLGTLGFGKSPWDEEFWDTMARHHIEDFPEACRKELFALPPAQRCAAITLGFRSESWRLVWLKASKGYKTPIGTTITG